MNLAQTTLILVGGGHMGGALLEGFLRAGLKPQNVTLVDPAEHAQILAKKLGVQWQAETPQKSADVVLFAVKPQIMDKVLPAYQDMAEALFVSIAAGLDIGFFSQTLGAQAAIVRVMPNTPAAIGKGMSVLVANTQVSKAQRELVTTLLASVGETAWLEDEKLMDAVTAVSGSGPAYFFLLMEALEEAGIKQGLPARVARQLAVVTAAGAGALAQQKREEVAPAQLREAVTSKGGTTAAALDVFAAKQTKQIVQAAVEAAVARGVALRTHK